MFNFEGKNKLQAKQNKVVTNMDGPKRTEKGSS
jgi:hypothetical protein